MDSITESMKNSSLDERKKSVYISEISSPTRFYFQYMNNDNIDLVNAMSKVYESNPPGFDITDQDFIKGSMICAKILGRWDRAIVVSGSLKPEMKKVRLFFVDWGTVENVPKSNCRKLDEKYKEIPKLAHRAALHGIQPVGGKKLFDIEVIEKFISKVSNEILTIEVVKHHMKENFFEVRLFKDAANLADLMVKHGLAEQVIGDPKCLFYPSFQILEEADFYPTYGQRYDLLHGHRLKINFNDFEESIPHTIATVDEIKTEFKRKFQEDQQNATFFQGFKFLLNY